MPLVGPRPARSRWSALRDGAAPLVALAAVLAVVVSSSAPNDPAPHRLDDARLASFANPVPPASLTAAPLDTRVALSWPASTENMTAGYSVVYGPVGGTTTTTTVTGTSYTATGLVNGTAYRFDVYTITATNGLLGIGAQTNTGTTPVTRTATPVAAAPTGLVATPADRRTDLSWTAPADPSAASYRVLRDGAVVATVNAPTLTYADTGLVNGTSHTWTVRAVYSPSNNVSADSGPVTATPRDTTAPGAPTGLVATRGDTSVALSWAANPEYDVKTYQVRRDGAVVATVTAPSRSYTDTGLVNDRAYSYTLTATDTSGNTSAVSSPAVSATPTDLTPPAVPTGLTATRGDGSVALTWAANAETDLASYRVLRDGAEIATVPAGTTAFTDSGLVNDRTYAYRLVAVDTHGNRSAASDPAVSATPTDLTPPAVPTGLAAAAGDGSVVLTWTANTEPDLDGYDLYRDGVRVQGAVLGAGATSFTDAGLVNDRTYSYTLRARDRSGNSSASSAPVTATPTDTTPPATPTGLSAVRGDGVVSLSWAPNSESDLASYRLYRDGALIATITQPTTTFGDTGLVNDRSYSYALVAVDTHGNASPASAPVSATPTDLTPPATPTGFAAVPGDGRVVLSWTPNSEADLAGYRVLRDGVVVATVTQPATSYTDTGLVNDRAYTYRLVAVDAHGNGSPTTDPAVSATPRDTSPPAPPTGVSATPGDGQVVIGWAPNTEADLASYRVYRDGALLTTVTAPATSYTDTGLANGSAHTYEVSALDTTGNESARSSGGSATPADTTAPAAPTSPTTTRDDGRVTLSWTAPADGDVASYRVLRDGVEVASVDAPATSYSDTGLANGIQHTYAVVAVDRSGNRSQPSATTTGTAADDVAPAAPTAVSAAPGDGRATLSWTAPGDRDLASYLVLRADGTTVVATVSAPATTAVVTGLTNGTAVTFTVVAVDTSGNRSVLSVSVTTTPVASGPPAGGSGQSGALAVTRDGRYVLIATTARLEATDTNSASELYRIDTTGGSPARRVFPLPASASGSSDPTNASDVAISDDGNYVVLSTTAALVTSDTNRLADVYRGDLRQTPTRWELVSVPKGGGVSPSVAGTVLQTGASVYTTSPSVAVSASGDRVLFYSPRNDLVTGDTNGAVDVFAKDMGTGAVTRVSTATGGGNLPRTATGPALAASASGRYVFFTATSSSGPLVVYRKDLDAGEKGTALVVSSVTSAGRTTEVGAYRDTGDVAVSDDGNRVVFVTAAKLLSSTPSASGSTGLAYVKDIARDVVVALGNGQAGSWEHQVAIDGTGRYASFSTAAAQTPGDANGHTDVVRRDLATTSGGAPAAGDLVLVSANASGAAVTGPSGAVSPVEYGRVAMPADGTVVLVTVQPLVSGDTNGQRDLYRKDLATGVVTSVVTP